LTIKAFLPGMKQRGRGNIITISFAAARRPSGRSPLTYAAEAALFLASERAGWISGVTLDVAGGSVV
jgi:NAD(P)-dependent dehydrogenase (short-subunit alcohol dehydrogenase family)